MTPTVGYLSENSGALYAGKVNSIASEPEAGKTWFALIQVLAEIKRGRPVVYIDYEDDLRVIAGRLRALGASRPELDDLFIYIHPEAPLGIRTSYRDHLINDVKPSLVVLDGVTEAMTVEGMNLLDNAQTAQFFGRIPTPIARLGPAVLLLDHEVKRPDDRSRYPVGAQHKLAAVSGAAYRLAARTPMAIGREGCSEIQIVKDRPGQIRGLARVLPSGREVVGHLVVESPAATTVNAAIAQDYEPPAAGHSRGDVAKKIIECLRSEPSGFRKKTTIREIVGGNSQRFTDAFRELTDEGVITGEAPYRLVADPDNQNMEDADITAWSTTAPGCDEAGSRSRLRAGNGENDELRRQSDESRSTLRVRPDSRVPIFPAFMREREPHGSETTRGQDGRGPKAPPPWFNR